MVTSEQGAGITLHVLGLQIPPQLLHFWYTSAQLLDNVSRQRSLNGRECCVACKNSRYVDNGNHQPSRRQKAKKRKMARAFTIVRLSSIICFRGEWEALEEIIMFAKNLELLTWGLGMYR